MKKVNLIVYKSIFNDDTYYTTTDPIKKTIDGVQFIEVTTSLKHIKPLFVRADSIRKIGIVEHDIK